MEFIDNFYVNISWRKTYCGVFRSKVGKVTYYFIDNEQYFARSQIYGEYDDSERFAYFSKAILDVLNFVDFFPDIIHVNDWQTALTPVYLQAFYRGNRVFAHAGRQDDAHQQAGKQQKLDRPGTFRFRHGSSSYSLRS